MSVFTSAALYMLCGTLPYRILSYYPFRHQLRVSHLKIACLIGVTEVAVSLLYAQAVVNGGTGRAVELALNLICMAIYFSCIRADKFKLLYLYLFVFDYIMIVRGIAMFLEVRLFPMPPDMRFVSPRSVLIQMAVLAVTAPLIVQFLKRTKERVFQTDAPVFWRTIWLVPALTTVIVLVFTGILEPEQVVKWQFLMARVLLIVCVLVVYYILLQSLDTIRQEAAARERADQQAEIIALQRTQYEQIRKHMEETRQARHDLRQHLQVIQRYLEQGGTKELQDYIAAYGQTLPADTVKKYCDNYAVDVMVSYYGVQAEQAGIDFDCQILLPDVLPISEPEFCALLGNLLENAVDACREQREFASFIRLRCFLRGQNIVLTIDKTCAKPPAEQEGRLLSTKHSGYGLGTQSVRSVAARYHGVAEFTYDEGVFCVSVLLHFPG